MNTNNICVCPECKNKVDLTKHNDLLAGMVIECQMCGVTLEVKEVTADKVSVEIVDEGK